MTAFKKSFAVALTALTLSAAVLTTSGAEARPRYGWGVGAGIVGALAVGGLLAASSRPAYAYGYGYGRPVYAGYGPVRRCHVVERVNYYGDVVGHRRVCRSYY